MSDSKPARINTARMNEVATQTYHEFGNLISPAPGDTEIETVENVLGKQIGLAMGILGNIRALEDSELIDSDVASAYAEITNMASQRLQKELMKSLGLRVVTKGSPEDKALEEASKSSETLH